MGKRARAKLKPDELPIIPIPGNSVMRLIDAFDRCHSAVEGPDGIQRAAAGAAQRDVSRRNTCLVVARVLRQCFDDEFQPVGVHNTNAHAGG